MISVYLGGHSILDTYRKYCIDTYSNDFKLIDPIYKTDEILSSKYPHISSSDIKHKSKSVTKDVCIELCSADKELIDSCNILIAYIDEPTFGTVMEIMYAYMHKIPIFVICPHLEYDHDVWLTAHVEKFFSNIDSCFSYIKSINGIC